MPTGLTITLAHLCDGNSLMILKLERHRMVT
jgi:hypothetical protein